MSIGTDFTPAQLTFLVAQSIPAADPPPQYALLQDTYTKAQVDLALIGKANVSSLPTIPPSFAGIPAYNGFTFTQWLDTEINQILETNDLDRTEMGRIENDLITQYAKKSEVSAAVDLTPYALKTELPAPVDLSMYPDRSEVSQMVMDIGDQAYAFKSDIPVPVDLAPYALKSEVPGPMDLTPYALKTEIPAPVNLAPYALKTEIPTVPDISGLATKTELNNFPFVKTTRTVNLAAATTGTITTDWLYTINEVVHSNAVVLSLDATLSSGTDAYTIQIYNNGTTSIQISIPGLLSEGSRTYIRQRGVAALKRLSSGSWLLTGALQLTV